MANKSLAKDHADICVLVTGGAGFIGSHTCVELLDQGYHVVVVDDLSNSSELALDRVRQITGLAANDDRLKFYEANILDRAALDSLGGVVGAGDAKTAGTMAGEPAADGTRRGVGIFNLGTGTGSSVLDVVHSFERACGRELPYQIKPRRAGDVAVNYAACDKARDELGWVAQYDLDRMCADGWRWQSQNPDGYATARA